VNSEFWFEARHWESGVIVEKQVYSMLFSSMELARAMCRVFQDELYRQWRDNERKRLQDRVRKDVSAR
jgi:hypothetical protein